MDANNLVRRLPVHQNFNPTVVVRNDFQIIDTGRRQSSSYINDHLLQVSTTLLQVSVTLLSLHLIRPIAAIILILASLSLAALTAQCWLRPTLPWAPLESGNSTQAPSSYSNNHLLQIFTTLLQVSVTLLISHLIRPIAAIILVLASLSLAALTVQSFLLRNEVQSLPYHAAASDAPARWQRMASRIYRPLHICAFVCLLLLTAFALLI
ncbi:hypothetical protein KP509_39G034100 [Ceratopteris richardii]|uniref:Uncharacterized protein n=1 Tax=Ceratopteris richardii TaxID=49495 RepID=A0A8T2Q0A6_CERRI|nr:hypothetical protein KP509_39G034100 [Ceratopteris richardii]